MERNSKILLSYLVTHGDCGKYYDFNEDIDKISSDLCLSPDNLLAEIRFLHDSGYIDYQSDSHGRNLSFSLSYQGLNWKYFRRKEILDYISDKWIDFFAFLVSGISLALSILALLQN